MNDSVGYWRQHIFNLQDWWSIASDECRQEFIDELNRCGKRCDLWSDVDRRFGFNYNNSINLLGDSCVYAWATDDGEIVYIGCGDRGRASNINSRSGEFKEMMRKKPMKSFIICYNVCRDCALDIETLCIWRCQLMHHPLVNKEKMLTNTDMFAVSSGRICEKSEEYEKLQGAYPDAVKSLDKLLEYCFNCASKGDGKLDKDPLFNRGRRRKTAVKTAYCIEGKIKPITEWCKEYGKSYGFVIRRVAHGCTPLEALTFPSHPEHKTLELMEYWESIGCHPGTDKTSYVVPFDEIPEEILYLEVKHREAILEV